MVQQINLSIKSMDKKLAWLRSENKEDNGDIRAVDVFLGDHFSFRNEPSMALGNGSASVAVPSAGRQTHHILPTLPSSSP